MARQNWAMTSWRQVLHSDWQMPIAFWSDFTLVKIRSNWQTVKSWPIFVSFGCLPRLSNRGVHCKKKNEKFKFFLTVHKLFKSNQKDTKYSQMTSEVNKKNFRSFGLDLTNCQLLLSLTSVKSDEKAIGICQSLCKTCLQDVIAQIRHAM